MESDGVMSSMSNFQNLCIFGFQIIPHVVAYTSVVPITTQLTKVIYSHVRWEVV